MKYFSQEYLNSLPEGEEGNRLLKMQEEKYIKAFDECSSRLPINFVTYYENYGFHDDLLEKFEIVKRRSEGILHTDIVALYESDDKYYEIRYFDVAKFESSLRLDNYVPFGDYLDGEILAVDDQYLSHEFLFFSCDSYFLIWFKKLSFTILKYK